MPDWLRTDRQQNRDPAWFAADALVALVFVWITVESLRSNAYVDEFGPIEGWGWVLALSPNALLLVRRVGPATALALATVLYMLASGWQGDSNAPLAVPFFAYSVGLTRPVSVSGLIVAVAAAAMSTSILYGPGDPIVLAVAVWFMLYGVGWLVAVSIRRNQARASELAAEADTLRAESADVAERAVADERARIARELHDAVGHAVNVMVLQAGAARLTADDERVVNSLREIERVGRTALTDLDHMLGLMRADDGGLAPLEPARSTNDIIGLIDDMRAAGADIHFDNRCGAELDRTMGRPAGAAVYRIVQEALTNAVKHAGPARIDVVLSCPDDDLLVSVLDDGFGDGAPPARGGGRGIAGMTERAKVLGGELSARPRPGGGFRVEARIPRRADDPADFRVGQRGER